MKKLVLESYPNAKCEKEYFSDTEFIFIVSYDKNEEVTALLGMGETEKKAWKNALK